MRVCHPDCKHPCMPPQRSSPYPYAHACDHCGAERGAHGIADTCIHVRPGDHGWLCTAGQTYRCAARDKGACNDCHVLEPTFQAVDMATEFGEKTDPRMRFVVIDAECVEVAFCPTEQLAEAVAYALRHLSGELAVKCARHSESGRPSIKITPEIEDGD